MILLAELDRILISMLLTFVVHVVRWHKDPRMTIGNEWLCWFICVVPFIAWEAFTYAIAPSMTTDTDIGQMALGALIPTCFALGNRIYVSKPR